jgi:hypothetical protein
VLDLGSLGDAGDLLQELRELAGDPLRVAPCEGLVVGPVGPAQHLLPLGPGEQEVLPDQIRRAPAQPPPLLAWAAAERQHLALS